MLFQLALLLLAVVPDCSAQLGKGGSALSFVGKVSKQPKLRANAKREVLKYGSIDLLPKSAKKIINGIPSLDKNGQSGIAIISKGLCTSCTILSACLYLTLEDGGEASPANGVYIHHFVSYDQTKKINNVIQGCEGGLPGASAPFVDRGEDSGDTETIFTTADGKFNTGFWFKNPRIMMQYDLVHYKEVTRKLLVNLEVEYVDGNVGQDAGHTLKTVTCNLLTGPKVNAAGPINTSSQRMAVTNNATIVWARGHLHAGGVDTKLMVNGKTVCTSLPTYNAKGVITSMSLCPETIRLKKGDSVTISSLYDLTKHKLREATDGSGHGAKGITGSDVMGMVGMSYAIG